MSDDLNRFIFLPAMNKGDQGVWAVRARHIRGIRPYPSPLDPAWDWEISVEPWKEGYPVTRSQALAVAKQLGGPIYDWVQLTINAIHGGDE
jgi:hypothetical protein